MCLRSCNPSHHAYIAERVLEGDIAAAAAAGPEALVSIAAGLGSETFRTQAFRSGMLQSESLTVDDIFNPDACFNDLGPHLNLPRTRFAGTQVAEEARSFVYPMYLISTPAS